MTPLRRRRLGHNRDWRLTLGRRRRLVLRNYGLEFQSNWKIKLKLDITSNTVATTTTFVMINCCVIMEDNKLNLSNITK